MGICPRPPGGGEGVRLGMRAHGSWREAYQVGRWCAHLPGLKLWRGVAVGGVEGVRLGMRAHGSWCEAYQVGRCCAKLHRLEEVEVWRSVVVWCAAHGVRVRPSPQREAVARCGGRWLCGALLMV